MLKISPTLWYDMDEVKDFHPHVEESLNTAILSLGLQNELEVVHHPSLTGTTTVPDFGVRMKSSKQYIFILEVKRSRSSVESERFWIQTKGYVTALKNQWVTPSPQYYAITNIEETIAFADRNEHVTRCILKGGRSLNGNFAKDDTTVFADVKDSFKTNLADLIKRAYDRATPEYIDNWLLLVDSFYSAYQSVVSSIKSSDLVLKREISLYELLRFLFYYYLRSSYTLSNHANSGAFRAISNTSTDPESFVNNLVNNFGRVLQIDFQQIFTDYPGPQRIIPGNLTEEVLNEFKRFIGTLEKHSDAALTENPSPQVFFNLLTNRIYEREELHAEGKIMSDPELAKLLAELTIADKHDRVIDPGTGDGSLLDASYEKLNILHLQSREPKTHNEILSQLHGYEIDPFLNQMATFRLLSKNLHAVDNHTEVDLTNDDVFKHARPNEFDVVLMNPPFLRNDDPKYPISASRKNTMLEAIKSSSNGVSLVEQASQPNLYFYFVEWIKHYLSEKGRAGIILMAKFLNNEDGAFLKTLIKESIESVIIYPKGYFKDFHVTTCIIVLQNNNRNPSVKFLKILNSNLLDEPENIKAILSNEQTTITSDFTLKIVERGKLVPEANWRTYLLDPRDNFGKIENSTIVKSINGELFMTVKRGGAENTGGSKTLFLNPRDKLASYFQALEKEFIGPAMQNSQSFRHPNLTSNDLTIETGIIFPGNYDNCKKNMSKLPKGFAKFFEAAEEQYTATKWKQIVNSAYRSQVKPDMFIPRAEREKHSIYINLSPDTVLTSTNFFYCEGLLTSTAYDDEISLKIIGAYLLSAFGQIQFELYGNNQEGMLKLEGFMIDKFKAIDPDLLTPEDVALIADAFDAYNDSGEYSTGDEGVTGHRRNLDNAIATVLMKHDEMDFESPEKLTDFVEFFLLELVEDRKS